MRSINTDILHWWFAQGIAKGKQSSRVYPIYTTLKVQAKTQFDDITMIGISLCRTVMKIMTLCCCLTVPSTGLSIFQCCFSLMFGVLVETPEEKSNAHNDTVYCTLICWHCYSWCALITIQTATNSWYTFVLWWYLLDLQRHPEQAFSASLYSPQWLCFLDCAPRSDSLFPCVVTATHTHTSWSTEIDSLLHNCPLHAATLLH